MIVTLKTLMAPDTGASPCLPHNVRGAQTYQRSRGAVDKTRPVKVAIGERRQPRPEGRPGFLRVDSVHQGDLDGFKGLYYHINRVDDVTQFQFVGSVERICERFLLPVLQALIESFPFLVLGFHADNGSEYINKRVAALLEKLRIEQFTKSRARKTNDNALVESKNGSVACKHLGYAHIPARFAAQVNAFTQGVLSPYLNFHRPQLLPHRAARCQGAGP
jgi:transposase InsO family protein